MGLCQENPLEAFLEQLDCLWGDPWASEKGQLHQWVLGCQEVWRKDHWSLMWENQKIHEQERASLCPAAPSRRWVIYQIPWAFFDTHLVRELEVLGSQPSWHMDPMEMMVWNQRNLVRKLVETEVGRKAQREGEEGVARTHPLKDLKWVSLIASWKSSLLG